MPKRGYSTIPAALTPLPPVAFSEHWLGGGGDALL